MIYIYHIFFISDPSEDTNYISSKPSLGLDYESYFLKLSVILLVFSIQSIVFPKISVILDHVLTFSSNALAVCVLLRVAFGTPYFFYDYGEDLNRHFPKKTYRWPTDI